jgi:hypothetical protein
MLRRHPLPAILVSIAAIALVIAWLLHVPHIGAWLQVHLGIVDEAGPYYGFWSGFGSDLAELSVTSRGAGASGAGCGRPIHAVLPPSPGLSRSAT